MYCSFWFYGIRGLLCVYTNTCVPVSTCVSFALSLAPFLCLFVLSYSNLFVFISLHCSSLHAMFLMRDNMSMDSDLRKDGGNLRGDEVKKQKPIIRICCMKKIFQ